MSEGYNLLQPKDDSATDFDLSVPQEQKPISSLQIANSDEQIIENIVRQATDTKDTEKRILDDLEAMDAKLMLDLPVSVNDVKRVKVAKATFYVCLVFCLVVGGFFYSAKNNYLGLGSVNFVSESQAKLLNLQTEKLMNSYTNASLMLDKLAFQVSALNYDINFNDSKKSQNLKKDLLLTLQEIKETLNFAAMLIVENQAIESELVIKFSDLKSKYEQQIANEKDQAKLDELKQVNAVNNNAAKVSRNSELRQLLIKETLSDDLAVNELLKLSTQVLFISDNSSISKVALVEVKRNRWTQILNELETIIKEFDTSFRIFKPNKEDSMISLANYSFNTDTGIITVNGEIKTDDSKLFTAIVNLTDALENSALFKDLDIKSFSKTLLQDSGLYTSTLSLNFNIDNPNSF